jgi:AcrR family transcriptional regulator
MMRRAATTAGTRDRIIHAMLQLAFEHAYEDITLASIAREAGVSHQTVLNHFESKEGVAAAAAAVLGRETQEARDKAQTGDPAGAVTALIGEYERFGDANVRWALSAERLGSLAPLLDQARAGHQAWLQRIFADVLPKAPGRRRQVVLALHAATDVYTWKLLRRDLHLTRAETETIMVRLVNGVLNDDSRRQRSTGAGR